MCSEFEKDMKPQHKVNHFFKSQSISHDPQQLTGTILTEQRPNTRNKSKRRRNADDI